jgi:ketosteroid isomerase-like protein
MAEPAALVADYFDCVNRDDWTGLRALWHPDGEWRAVGARPRTGRDQVIEYFTTLFEPWSSHHDEPVRVVVGGSVATVEVRFEGITLEGTPIGFDAVDIFDVADGLIRRMSNWYDLVFVRRQLAAAALAASARGASGSPFTQIE